MLIDLDDQVAAMIKKLAKEDEKEPIKWLKEVLGNIDENRHVNTLPDSSKIRCKCGRPTCQEFKTTPGTGK